MLLLLDSAILLLPGAVATFLEHVGGPLRLAERHHSHHDTYIVTPDFTRSLVVAMLLMSCVGMMLCVLSAGGMFHVGYGPICAFAGAFVYAFFFAWLLLMRYKVALFDDHAVITSFIGPDKCIFYSDITSIDWTGVRRRTGYRDLLLTTRDGSVAVRGIVDIEQVLLHVDRFDVLAQLGGPAERPLEALAQRMRAQDAPHATLALGNHTQERAQNDD